MTTQNWLRTWSRFADDISRWFIENACHFSRLTRLSFHINNNVGDISDFPIGFVPCNCLQLSPQGSWFTSFGEGFFCPHKEQSGGGYSVFVKEFFLLSKFIRNAKMMWVFKVHCILQSLLHQGCSIFPRLIYIFNRLPLCFIRPLQLNFSCWLSNEFDPFVSKGRKGAKNLVPIWRVRLLFRAPMVYKKCLPRGYS